eukprot:CAMPEP_0169138730 /NCGR_PEP_ID=MMETSP1015-20121227/42485_1 /TAXON_ID=342587 /ORGANISM="Karlodinium micrum, Strain CCMP2283" /LENGTH=77 /DNA_ID=CAMNT_0009204175 /DNA_START=56 /DNA_END=289 /DNA_ORIENTATION=+
MSSLLGSVPGAGDMAEKMKAEAKKKIEDQVTEQAPGYVKMFFPCCGGPVGTVEKMMFAVPADQQDAVKTAIGKYKEM